VKPVIETGIGDVFAHDCDDSKNSGDARFERVEPWLDLEDAVEVIEIAREAVFGVLVDTRCSLTCCAVQQRRASALSCNRG
jgi:hypothetical protein